MTLTTVPPEDFNKTRAFDRMPKTGDLITLRYVAKGGNIINRLYLVLGEPFRHTKSLTWFQIDLLDITEQTIKTESFDNLSFTYCLVKQADE